MGLSNDERGWVMTSLSGIACVLGASIICVDLIIRQFPGQRDFRIQDSDTFLSLSLSLSFGVMLFSALYSMLPSAKMSLVNDGFSAKAAAWILIACFIGGVVGIQLLSRVMHRFIPSHVVDCEHNHEEGELPKENGDVHDDEAPRRPPNRPRNSSLPGHTPLGPKTPRAVSRQTSYFNGHGGPHAVTRSTTENSVFPSNAASRLTHTDSQSRRPSLQQRLTTGISHLTSNMKESCDCDGPCYGFSDPCGSDCFKKINARGGIRGPLRNGSLSSRPPMSKSATMSFQPTTETSPLLGNISEEPRPSHHHPSQTDGPPSPQHSPHTTAHSALADLHKTHSNETTSSPTPDHHHHHVPTNAFLSIGLQTSLAIALHKLPEGFITYATNHANPRLGFSVFLALFIHNITEGFAMALPLYLALNSRAKAMAWSLALGGLSQPVGAGVAAQWFKIAGTEGEWAPSEGGYGAMFAVTAGIMASVALQLFGESLELTHSRGLCMIGAFTGMTILGISSALTA
ncbi:Zinc transporter [Oleoguttula sp. CCFEE 5521]